MHGRPPTGDPGTAATRPAPGALRRRLGFAAALAMLCIGCSTPTRYEPTVTSAEDGAVVSGWIRYFPLLKVVIMDVDGRPRLGWDTQMPEPLLVDPGVRILRVRGEYITYDWLPVSGHADADFTVDLQAGHRYDLRIERHDRMLAFWIEDAGTHAEIGARQTREASVSVIVGGPSGLPH